MDFASKRIPVEALIFRCPFGEARESCAVGYLRQMSVFDALVLVSEMGRDELDGLLTQHEACFAGRAMPGSESIA